MRSITAPDQGLQACRGRTVRLGWTRPIVWLDEGLFPHLGTGVVDRMAHGEDAASPRDDSSLDGPMTVFGDLSGLRLGELLQGVTDTSLALELAEKRPAAEELAVFSDRDRIARDLHDHVRAAGSRRPCGCQAR